MPLQPILGTPSTQLGLPSQPPSVSPSRIAYDANLRGQHYSGAQQGTRNGPVSTYMGAFSSGGAVQSFRKRPVCSPQLPQLPPPPLREPRALDFGGEEAAAAALEDASSEGEEVGVDGAAIPSLENAAEPPLSRQLPAPGRGQGPRLARGAGAKKGCRANPCLWGRDNLPPPVGLGRCFCVLLKEASTKGITCVEAAQIRIASACPALPLNAQPRCVAAPNVGAILLPFHVPATQIS